MLKVGVTQKIRPTYRMEEKSLPHLICDVSLLFWSWYLVLLEELVV